MTSVFVTESGLSNKGRFETPEGGSWRAKSFSCQNFDTPQLPKRTAAIQIIEPVFIMALVDRGYI